MTTDTPKPADQIEVPAGFLAIDPRRECWRWSDEDHQWLFDESAYVPVTLPAIMTDLVCKCAPVCGIVDPTLRGVVVDECGGDLVVGYEMPWREHQTGALYEARPVNAHRLALLLDEQAGRDQAARWLWRERWPECPPCSLLFSHNPHTGLWQLNTGLTRVSAGPTGSDEYGPLDSDGCHHTGGWVVPALADLDPSDRTLLADGSRRVDALALQAVCLHVWSQQ